MDIYNDNELDNYYYCIREYTLPFIDKYGYCIHDYIGILFTEYMENINPCGHPPLLQFKTFGKSYPPPPSEPFYFELENPHVLDDSGIGSEIVHSDPQNLYRDLVKIESINPALWNTHKSLWIEESQRTQVELPPPNHPNNYTRCDLFLLLLVLFGLLLVFIMLIIYLVKVQFAVV